MDVDVGVAGADFGGNVFSFFLSSIDKENFRNIFAGQFQRGCSACATRAELKDFCPAQFNPQVFLEGASDSISVGIEAMRADFTRGIGELPQRQPVSRKVFAFETDRIYSAPKLCGCVQHVDEIERQQFVRHSEIQADELQRRDSASSNQVRRYPRFAWRVTQNV